MKVLNAVVPAVLLFPCVSLADAEFGDDMPREVAEQFIRVLPGSTTRLYSDIFGAFPQFDLPSGFTVLASADMGVMQRALLRTTLDDAAAASAMVQALLAEGWVEMPIPNATRGGGFVTAAAPTQNLSLCNDQLGRMSVSVNTTADTRYVNLGFTNVAAFGGSSRTCAEEADMMTRGPAFGFGPGGPDDIRQQLPRLLLPETDTTDQQARIMAVGGGSMNDFEARGNVAIDWSAQQLFEHFAAQIEEQGWTRDTDTSGTQAAFGNWTRTVDDREYIGALSLLETREDTWDLKFRIVRRGGGPAANRVVDEVR